MSVAVVGSEHATSLIDISHLKSGEPLLNFLYSLHFICAEDGAFIDRYEMASEIIYRRVCGR